MPEAVIVDAVRSPIGRAFKGSLAQLRPEETAAFVVDQLLERNPDARPKLIEDVYCGCGMPQGLQALQRRPDHRRCSPSSCRQEVTGTTISRYCASSLDAIRHAANAIKAGEGDAYIAAGVECVSRFNERTEPAGAADRNPNLIGENGQPNAYIDMGLTAVNVAKKYEVSRADMDKYAQRSQELAVAVAGGRLLRPRDRPGHRPGRQRGRQGRRPARLLDPGEALRAARGVQGGGGVTAGNSCPLNDGAAAVLVMSDTKAKELGPDAEGAAGHAPRPGATSPSTWASPRSARSRRSSTAPG